MKDTLTYACVGRVPAFPRGMRAAGPPSRALGPRSRVVAVG